MKIGIVGCGMVGSTAAYALIMRGIGREIVLVDMSEKRAEAEANDLSHAIPFSNPLLVRKGSYSDLRDARMVVISAGVSQKPGETRLDLLRRNAEVFRETIPKILQYAGDAIIVIATNPLDIMTCLATRFASEYGIAASRVFGTGTMLDTARFRTLVGEHIGIDPHHIHGYVIGEHGDSEVLTWSLVTVAAMHLEDYCSVQHIPMDDKVRADIDKRVRNAAYNIIEGKGATYYGIGGALARIADVILHDQRSILTVSGCNTQDEGLSDISISIPQLVGGQGIIRPIPIRLSKEEDNAFKKSAEIIRAAVRELQA